MNLKNSSFNEIEKFLKRALKKKVSFGNDTVIKYLMMGILGLSLTSPVFAEFLKDGGQKYTKGSAEDELYYANGDEGSIAIGKESKSGAGSVTIGQNAKAVGRTGVAIGYGSNSTGESIAVGLNANAGFNNSVVMGSKAGWIPASNVRGSNGTGNGSNSVIIGSEAKGAQSTVSLGYKSNAAALSSSAIGSYSEATGEFAIAWGNGQNKGTAAVATGHESIAMGRGARSSGQGAIAMGYESNATGQSSIAMLYASKATANGALALGRETTASARHAVALGGGAKSTASRSIAIGASKDDSDAISGTGAQAQGVDSISIGTSSIANEVNAIALGREANASGVNAIALGRKANATQWATALGNETKATADDTVALGNSAQATAQDATALGAHTQATAIGSTAIGSSKDGSTSTRSVASAQNAIAIGGSTASGTNSISIGTKSVASANNSISIGNSANTTAGNAVAVGANSLAGDHSAAYGYNAKALGTGSVALGEMARTETAVNSGTGVNRATALGNNSSVTVGGGVALGYKSTADRAGGVTGVKQTFSGVNNIGASTATSDNNIGAVSVGASGLTRQIINVAAASQDTDAVNLAQLKSMTLNIEGNNVDANEGKAGDTTKVGLWDGSLKVKGTGSIKTTASGDTITISIDESKLSTSSNPDTYFHTNDGITTQGAGNSTTNKGKITDKAGAIGTYSVTAGVNAQAAAENTIAIGHGSKATANATGSVVIGNNNTIPAKNSYIIGENVTVADRSALNVKILEKAIAIGKDITLGDATSKFSQDNMIAIGEGSSVKRAQAIAIGKNVASTGTGAVAIGGNSTVQEGQNIGVEGIATKAIGDGAVAVGTQAQSLAQGSVAMGNNAKSQGGASIAIGENAVADSTAGGDPKVGYATALGSKAQAKNASTVAIGYGAIAEGSRSISLGRKTSSTGATSVAIGNEAKATTEGGLALGAKSEATVAGNQAGEKQKYSDYTSTATGAFTSTSTVENDKIGAVSVGKADGSLTRQIVGVAAGTNDTDAVNVAQLKSMTLNIAGNETNTAEGTATDSTKVGLWNGSLKVKGTGSITTKASGDTITINGSPLSVTADSNGTYTSNTLTMALKTNNAWNTGSYRYSGDNIETYKTNDGILIGIKENPMFKSVQYGDNGPKITNDSGNLKVTGSNGSTPVKITNVADGDVSADSKDAVNGSQLNTVKLDAAKKTSVKAADGQNIVTVTKSDTSNATGGDEYVVAVNKDNLGIVTDLKYKANGTNEQTVALTTGLNFTNGANTTASVDADGVIKYDVNSELKGITSISNGKNDTKDDGAKITLSDDPNNKTVNVNNSKITNVAAGTNNNDAVNVSQLNEVKNQTDNIYFHTNSGDTGQGNGNSNTNKGKITDKAGATGKSSLAAGLSAKASGTQSIAIGKNANASGNSAIAIGNGDP
ncbi:beta strand repeat-containing protein, partial [Fusobacterium gastrosuis]|uniref:beta strand repeat-containing protein n=1 Tax=Fusobacterium gastrosuis TaxID=1755100 RepID=UPI00297339ED|nr:hypothetical protein [Fusobacteriaceae bacterium]MDY5713317.1 hypothetical protein [Fusobacterium gastrosuis]